MSKRNVIIELKHRKPLARYATAAAEEEEPGFDHAVVPKLEALAYDESFPVVGVAGLRSRKQSDDPFDTSALLEINEEPEATTYIVRGTVDEDALESLEEQAERHNAVAGVFVDRLLQTQIVCPGSPPVGTDNDVEGLLCTSKMHRQRMDGRGVLVAIVDTGVNTAYLSAQGKHPTFDLGRSWAWKGGLTPGSMAVGHGTMCAFDVCIAAPRCTLLDIAVLHPIAPPPGGTVMGALLSDAIRAYRHLLSIMLVPHRPGENRSMVVNNSWGMFHPSWDYPVGHPGNYSDNPNHPFNRIVASLERAGADILFAAGNCGADCPDGRCQGTTSNAIYGANSHPAVLCVGGVDTNKDRVGYSTIGPGRITRRKPDICGYTHFSGSGVYPADGGTSAATPVVSGVVAGVRSKRPYNPSDAQTHPEAIRNLLRSTAEDRGAAGYDYRYGYGIVDGCALVDKLVPPVKPPPVDICRWFPWICDPRWWRHIGLRPPFPLPLQAAAGAPAVVDGDKRCPISQMLPGAEFAPTEEMPSPEQLAYFFGYQVGLQRTSPPEHHSDCGCGEKERQ
ncbi:MAG: S8 family serine peptidase [Candidatus Krumholzibacteriota bacterium]|nr:S8 family serine peptidase [Candidatus Krumholzibacteriota bacterium]